jgi:hypothetical protein
MEKDSQAFWFLSTLLDLIGQARMSGMIGLKIGLANTIA